MKLFTIRDTTTGATLAEYFSQQHLARRRRDELNGGRPDEEGIVVRYVVTAGPDHHDFKE